MADDHDRPVVESSEASDDGTVVAELAVSMELKKIPKEIADVIERAGSLGMPGELRALPGSQFTVERMFDLGQLHPQLADLILRGRFSGRNGREFFDLFFDLADRLFKLEVIAHIVSKDINIGEGNTDTLP